MEIRVGRLIDHMQLRVRNLAASRRFYDAVLATLDRSFEPLGTTMLRVDELIMSEARPDETVSHIHLAFQMPDRATVDAFHRAALAAGGHDNGPPGERPYHPGYYACFVLDPDGSNIEAVFHGPGVRSAPFVEIVPI